MKNWDIEDFGTDSLFAETIKLAKIGIYELNVATNQIYWSDVTRDITEVPDDFVPSLDNLASFFNEGHYRDMARDAMQNAIAKGESYDLDMEVVTAKGNIRYVRNVGNPKMENGVCVKLFGFLQDITERKRTKIELTKKIQQLNLAEQLAQIGYWEWDIVADNILWSDNLYRIFGLEIGTPIHFERVIEAIHPDDRKEFRENAQEFIAEKRFRKFMHRIVHKDGSIRTVELIGELIMNPQGEVIKMIGTTQDITEQRMSEIKFRGLLDSAPDTMVIVDRNGIIQLINKQAEKMFGYKSSELIDKHVTVLVPNRLWDTMEYYAVNFFKAPKHTGLPADLDFFVHNKSGFQIPVQVTLSPLETSEGLLVSIALRDITVQKQAAHRILETNKSLKESAKRLKAQNRQLEEFNQITSHNLRSPVSNLSALLDIYKTESDSETKEMIIEKIESVTNHLTWTLDTLVESLLIKKSSQQALEKCHFDKTLERTKEMLAAEILKTEAVITSDFSEAPTVMYNKVYLESIFINLISNSLKYKAKDRAPEIVVQSKMIDGTVQLEFRDNGSGINLKKNGHKLFGFSKVFHRNDDAKGVGLFITKAQVDAMGGKIWAKSEEGKGTSFFINL
ncbi:PAS domain S-box protein [Allomuricauda sp. ARW1Y1]|jgi:PAS domain S-box-containing protein|uniref:PAS domain-containing sensor histidine kinase n=1 Tax=Allomuricauda sp. ARW1Y1 TaxID=2663843 RepID=UPI0015CB9C61|nr:PAS domain S-box protein [Muricauda sp. ARW1Y1]NYJ27766.1 PAS domain S-box-containing protein [Muricauda sp. ARW1Y1]